jgi:hypothetical protein
VDYVERLPAAVRRLSGLVADLEAERGEFTTFVMHAEHYPDVWRVQFSAPWVEAASDESLAELVPRIQSAVGHGQDVLLSSVIAVEDDGPGVIALRAKMGPALRAKGGSFFANDLWAGPVHLGPTFVLRCKPLPTEEITNG